MYIGNRYLLVVLFIVSAATQFAFLSYPNQVIFDEVHFGKFISAYCCTGERFFDIHPPQGKLLISAAAWIGGYDGSFPFQNIGDTYQNVPVFALRLVPALAGTLLPLVIFILLRQLGTSDAMAFLGGLAITLDNAFTVQSRIIALDGMLLLGVFGALSLFLYGSRLWRNLDYPVKPGNDSTKTLDYPVPTSPKGFAGRGKPGNDNNTMWIAIMAFAGAGALAGFAAGVKFTGLTGLVLIGLLVIMQVVRVLMKTPSVSHLSEGGLQAFRWVGIGLLILGSAAIVYFAGWYVHFALLTNPGSGDAWGVPTGNFLEDTIVIQKKMLNANYGLTATHPYSSMWWSWPIMKRPIFYWQGNEIADQRGMVYFIGNPVVWWGGSALFLVAIASFVFQVLRGWALRRGSVFAQTEENRKRKTENRKMKSEKRETVAEKQKSIFHFPFSFFLIPLAGYIISFLPFIRIPRALFLYHYMMPLVFSLLFGLVWLDKVYFGEMDHKQKALVWYYGVIGTVVFGFILFAPLTYGFPAGKWQSFLFWFSTWR